MEVNPCDFCDGESCLMCAVAHERQAEKTGKLDPWED